MNERLVVATDLDGTLTAGDPQRRAFLLEMVRDSPLITLLYVTGRSVDSARTLIIQQKLPAPALLIADIGTSVVYGIGPRRISSVERAIESAGWPGTAAVRTRLAGIDALQPQKIVSRWRTSYWIMPTLRLRGPTSTRDLYNARDPQDHSLSATAGRAAAFVAAQAAGALRDLPTDVLLSANVYLDVLPRGINKGSTLLRVLDLLGCKAEQCVVAGDSLNDHSLFETGARGIAVGNCEPALRAALSRNSNVYFAKEVGAGGIVEGLQYYDALPIAARHGERGRSLAQ